MLRRWRQRQKAVGVLHYKKHQEVRLYKEKMITEQEAIKDIFICEADLGITQPENLPSLNYLSLQKKDTKIHKTPFGDIICFTMNLFKKSLKK